MFTYIASEATIYFSKKYYRFNEKERYALDENIILSKWFSSKRMAFPGTFSGNGYCASGKEIVTHEPKCP